MQILIIIGIIIILILLFIDLYDNKKTKKEVLSQNKKVSLVSKTLQEMFDTISKELTVSEKLKKLNSLLMRAFNARYSSIVLFDGNSFEVKATNVEETFKDALCKIADDKIFLNNNLNNISKYVISQQDKELSYKSAVERNIKSAIFSPIYYNDLYLGFWLIEDTKENAFDNISEKDLEVLKHNISLFIENTQVQTTIEIAENTDKQTGFYNNVYLYSNTRALLTTYDTSTISLICLKNIPEINERYSRNLGNTLILKVANAIKEITSKDSLLVRYSGIRLLVITPNSNAQASHLVMEQVLKRIQSEVEYIGDDKVVVDAQILMHTFKKQNNIEKEIQNMVSYIDHMRAVNTIKII